MNNNNNNNNGSGFERDSVRYLTIAEAADLMRSTPRALYNLIYKGEFPGVHRYGRRILIRRSALIDWLESSVSPHGGRHDDQS